jgi:hypothetical protein
VPRKPKPFDVVVEPQGSVVLFQPLTQAAHAWIGEHVQTEAWPWFGSALAVEWCFAQDLVDEMRRDSLKVQAVNQ